MLKVLLFAISTCLFCFLVSFCVAATAIATSAVIYVGQHDDTPRRSGGATIHVGNAMVHTYHECYDVLNSFTSFHLSYTQRDLQTCLFAVWLWLSVCLYMLSVVWQLWWQVDINTGCKYITKDIFLLRIHWILISSFMLKYKV